MMRFSGKELVGRFARSFAAGVLAVASIAAQAGTVTYFHNDIAGSPVVATDSAGQVLWRESYRPYGERLTNAPASADNKVWFTSRRQDVETGLVYMGARYYDPLIGRFISRDPVEFDEANLHSHNRYAYANNNPYRYKDPRGRVAEMVWDLASFTLSVAMFKQDPSLGNFLGAAVDGVALAIPFVPGGVGAIRAIGNSAEAAAKLGAEVADSAGKFSKEKEALVEMAKADKRKGISEADMQAYKDLNKGLPDPFPSNKVRGPESHGTGGVHSQQPHGHVGPVHHIPIRDVAP